MTDPSKPPFLQAVPDLPEGEPPEDGEGEPEFAVGADGMRAPTAEEIIETMAQHILTQLPTAHAFAPEFPLEQLPRVARFIAEEQFMINTKILPRMCSQREPKPKIALKFTIMPDNASEGLPLEGVQIEAVRRLEGVHDPMDASRMAFVYAFFDSPTARAILRMNHYAYAFSFVGDTTPRIIT
jgi:hypothetical protein